jgi:DNA repair protein RadC
VKYYKQIQKFNIVSEKTTIDKYKATSSFEINKIIRSIADFNNNIDIVEEVNVLLLSKSNMIIGYANISKGGISSSIVDIRIVMKYAIDSLASSIVLIHNHPSGNLHPSDSDKDITKKIKNACALLEIQLLDHIIITSDDYYSFADQGIL